MKEEDIYKALILADAAAATAANLYAAITSATGQTVEEIRAQRDALSKDTHAILDEELAKINN